MHRAGRGRTVLIADDEAAVRKLLEVIVGSAGYHVLAAASGPEALKIAASHSGEIHVLLSDILMPGMTGIELAGEMERRHPGIKVILISGFGPDLSAVGSRWRFVEKPFSPQELLRKLNEALPGTRTEN